MNNIIDKLMLLEKGSAVIEGFLGEKLQKCIDNGIMAVDYTLYTNAFKEKYDDPSSWGGEFWGKWFTSAAFAYRYQPTIKHKKILDDAVNKLLEAQEPSGRLSSYKNDFGDWDIWGRKYALLGLVSYYEQTGNTHALECACASADSLIEITGPGKRKLTETGLEILQSLSSSSILEPIVLLYKHTKNNKYLDFALNLVDMWSEPNSYTKKGMRLIEDSLAGVHPTNISSPKSYEMMSCFEGLCELYRATENETYFKAAKSFAESVIQYEIMVTGSGSCCELWCDGANRQTEMLENPIETCVTATWMKFCFHLLRLTGESKWADQLEITLYNALLGAMMPEGNWWSYFSPLVGHRKPSHVQVERVKSSCCVASGPRGLMTSPHWSVMLNETGPVVNLYTKGKWEIRLMSGQDILLIQETCYPENGKVKLLIAQKEKIEYTLSLRIPNWSKNTKISVNSEKYDCTPGEYLEIKRVWDNNDSVEIDFDMCGRIVSAHMNYNYKSVMVGPIVLALDNRLLKPEEKTLWICSSELKWKHNNNRDLQYALLGQLKNIEQPIDVKPVQNKPEGIWLAYEVPFLHKPSHFFKHTPETLILCDYQSAGNKFNIFNSLRVWMPQPMYLQDAFPSVSQTQEINISENN